jgi:chorismate-pyruvate lyase
MKSLPDTAGPELSTLFALFPPAGPLPDCAVVAGEEVPEPYHSLLVHEHHMTVTVEAHHGGPVDVVVLERQHQGDSYARKILLKLHGTDKVVQFGIVRINLGFCTPAARTEILSGRTPLGRILIKHNVLRRIEPTTFLRVRTNPALTKWFGLDRPRVTYGRLAYIHCDEKPAIELLEIVAPE